MERDAVLRRTQSAARSASYNSSRPALIRHPTPDLQTLQGAYTRNIANLERSAEEMSNSGSDLGEEIRRLSRASSVQSSHHGSRERGTVERVGSGRSNRSASQALNGSARWGGYSPTGYVASPGRSPSDSWSHPSLSRVQSGSRSSRLAQVTEPLEDDQPLRSPLRSGFGIQNDSSTQRQEQGGNLPVADKSREVSQTSFGQRYDEIAGQIEQSLVHVPPSPTKQDAQIHRNEALHQLEDGGSTTPPERPRSTDTYREAQIAFKDFDGVHFSPDSDEFVELDQYGNEIRRVSARSVSGGLSNAAVSMLRSAHERPISQAPPPPDANMVYYPAPVPRMLNLPKRLSQLPAANIQAKRRSQVLGTVPDHVRDGAPWLSQNIIGEDGAVTRERRSGSGSSRQLSGGFLNERMSANLNNLPPQLRANMFFEHQPVQHDVEVKSESAVATLDSILAASATAPVHAFTDHPYAGDVRSSVYSVERAARKSTATLGSGSSPEQNKVKKRRSSSIGALLKRTTSRDTMTDKLRKRSSRTSMLTDFTEGGSKLKKRQSQLSLATQLEKEAQTPTTEISEPALESGLIASAHNAEDREMNDYRVSQVPTIMSSGYRLDDADLIEDDFKEEEAAEEAEEGEVLFVQPSTLLAELQVRKAQLKARTKTAATAFPQGMHSTLLELDAVEEINKRKRQHQRIALAWEDPHQRALDEDLDRNDEDVPLGMLFPSKEGNAARKVGDGRDFDRPLGLMEKRALEDNEPLSSRLRRLRGGSPTPGRTPNASQMNLAGDGAEDAEKNGEEDEDEGETLGQRMRRMKTKTALDGAIADVVDEPNEGGRPQSGLVDDVMSQFGGLDVKEKESATAPSPQPEEEETLGQRRARLQREREASGEQRNVSGDRPRLNTSNSFANLLASNPVGQRAASKNYQPAQGSLLHSSEQAQAKHRTQLQSTNMNSSFHGLERPLVDSRQRETYQSNAGGLLSQGQHLSRAATGGFGGGTFNNGMGGIQIGQTPTASSMNGYFASPTASYGYQMGGMMNPYAMQQQSPMMAYGFQQQQQPMMNPLVYNTVSSGGNQGMTGFSNAYMNGGGTYASFAQNQGAAAFGGAGGMPPGMGAMGMGVEELNPNQRAAIDRWRLSVAGQ